MDEIIIEQIISNPNSGNPIPPQIKYELEQRFKVDLSEVKIHSGPESKSFLYRIGAQAYVKENNFFIQSDTDDKKLKQALIEELTNSTELHTATHEAAHVVQQRGSVHL